MKLFNKMGIALACGLAFLCAACSNVSQGYADKVNNAVKDSNPITLEAAKKDLGDNTIDATFAGIGFIAKVEGCTTEEELKAVLEDGKTAKGIVIGVFGNKCVAAVYGEINEQMFDDLMKQVTKK